MTSVIAVLKLRHKPGFLNPGGQHLQIQYSRTSTYSHENIDASLTSFAPAVFKWKEDLTLQFSNLHLSNIKFFHPTQTQTQTSTMPPRTILKIRRSSRLQTKNLLRGPLTKFTLFPELPTEIRAMIWSFVVEEERIVVLEAFFKVDGVAIRSRDESDKRSWISKEPGYEDALALKTPQPVLLHVCAESRAIALVSLMVSQIHFLLWNFYKFYQMGLTTHLCRKSIPSDSILTTRPAGQVCTFTPAIRFTSPIMVLASNPLCSSSR